MYLTTIERKRIRDSEKLRVIVTTESGNLGVWFPEASINRGHFKGDTVLDTDIFNLSIQPHMHVNNGRDKLDISRHFISSDSGKRYFSIKDNILLVDLRNRYHYIAGLALTSMIHNARLEIFDEKMDKVHQIRKIPAFKVRNFLDTIGEEDKNEDLEVKFNQRFHSLWFNYDIAITENDKKLIRVTMEHFKV